MPLQIPKEIPPTNKLSRIVYGRLFSNNNFLMIIEGPTGIGKSWMGLKLCETYDPDFTAKNIVFTVEEFLELFRTLPERSFILWDEPGAYISHRDFGTVSNKIAHIMMQSGRFKFINVIFALPSRDYMDKVCREMCHYFMHMYGRGFGVIYGIQRHPMTGWIMHPKITQVMTRAPSKKMTDAYEQKKREHMEKLYAGFDKELKAMQRRKEEKLERDLKPKLSFEQRVEQAKAILPDIMNEAKLDDAIDGGSTRGLINVPLLMERLNISGTNLAYRLRDRLLRDLVEEQRDTNES
jgi:hypothetical protein